MMGAGCAQAHPAPHTPRCPRMHTFGVLPALHLRRLYQTHAPKLLTKSVILRPPPSPCDCYCGWPCRIHEACRHPASRPRSSYAPSLKPQHHERTTIRNDAHAHNTDGHDADAAPAAPQQEARDQHAWRRPPANQPRSRPLHPGSVPRGASPTQLTTHSTPPAPHAAVRGAPAGAAAMLSHRQRSRGGGSAVATTAAAAKLQHQPCKWMPQRL